MEILTAYIRQNAPLDAARSYIEDEKPRTDIQAILTVLGRRKTGPKRERPKHRLDLTKSRLCGADVSGANLQDAYFVETNLKDTFLNETNLQGAVLFVAKLQGAFLDNANLLGARHLDPTQIKAAEKWQAAHYSPAFRAELGLPPEQAITLPI